jgi:hypothetical protein
MLKKKQKGNFNLNEEREIEYVLYDLKMNDARVIE